MHARTDLEYVRCGKTHSATQASLPHRLCLDPQRCRACRWASPQSPSSGVQREQSRKQPAKSKWPISDCSCRYCCNRLPGRKRGEDRNEEKAQTQTAAAAKYLCSACRNLIVICGEPVLRISRRAVPTTLAAHSVFINLWRAVDSVWPPALTRCLGVLEFGTTHPSDVLAAITHIPDIYALIPQ